LPKYYEALFADGDGTYKRQIQRYLLNYKVPALFSTFNLENLESSLGNQLVNSITSVSESHLKNENDSGDDDDGDDIIDSTIIKSTIMEDVNHQRKIDPYYGLEELESEINPRLSRMKNRLRQPLIVVASFIDRATNLGGICRTCEIFNVEKLIMDNMSVIKDEGFQNLSVTSDRWQPIEEVKPENLFDFFNKHRKLGYKIVAVEQTENSVKLTTFEFPQKTVLVLGKEREGLPVEFIQAMDYCVEIPQLGVTRSLNVHVASALMIYEFSKARGMLN